MVNNPAIVSLDGQMYFFMLPVSGEVARELALAARSCNGVVTSTCGTSENDDSYIAVVLSSNYWIDERLHQEHLDGALAEIWDRFASRVILSRTMPQPTPGNPFDMLRP